MSVAGSLMAASLTLQLPITSRAKKDVLKFQEELNCQGLSHQREL